MYKSFGGALGVQKLNSATVLIQRHQRRLPHAEYVLHRAGCSQEVDQLLREGWRWNDSRRGYDSRDTFRSGPLDENTSTTVDRSHGSHGFYRLDLRSPAAARSRAEGGASTDAASHRNGKKEKRSHRRQQDL